MSLKTDYYDGANGFTQKMGDVFDAGSAFITSNLASITSSLQANAAQGLKTFTISLVCAYQPANLRLTTGYHWLSFKSGITSALLGQDIYLYECTPELDTSDTVTLRVKLNFTF